MSEGVKSRKYTLKSHFSGLPRREDLEIVEEELPQLKDGGADRQASTVHDMSLYYLWSNPMLVLSC